MITRPANDRPEEKPLKIETGFVKRCSFCGLLHDENWFEKLEEEICKTCKGVMSGK